MSKIHLVLIFLVLFNFCRSKEAGAEPDFNLPVLPSQFQSVGSLMNTLNELSIIQDAAQRNLLLDSLWKQLQAESNIPFTLGDSVVLLYRGDANQVRWAGDFNGWNPQLPGFTGEKLQGTNLFYCLLKLPANARIDYKVVVNNNWMLDPINTKVQFSGFGPNSELRMPQWQPDPLALENPASPKGTLSSAFIISSIPANLNYQVSYKVYTPHSFSSVDTLPVILVTDGHEYADGRLGAMIQVLDNCIALEKISPVVVVFIDPRSPINAVNRRMTEYITNPAFLRFAADELLPHIRQVYHTSSLASKTAIMGTSLGGWNAAYFGLNRSDVFGNLIIHSPAFNQAMIQSIQQSSKLPLRVFMSTGTIYDTQSNASQMRQVMLTKGYDLMYVEVNEGHSWGNWRALINEPLEFLFPR